MPFRVRVLALLLFQTSISFARPGSDSIPARQDVVTIQYDPDHPLNVFRSATALGAGLDGHEKGDNAKMLSAENIRAMLSAGLKSLSYRLRTELAGEAWHWNPAGRWSDAPHQQGYWTSDSNSSKAILYSYGYRLPRRGNSVDQANDDGYSRIDDGDTLSFWKSNPYLDGLFTNDPDSLHPQWVVIDLGKVQAVNWLHIKWGNPFALQFKIQYAIREDPSFFNPYNRGMWHDIEPEQVTASDVHNSYIRLSKAPLKIRFLRIVCCRSSHTCEQCADVRDSLGYAIKEIQAGLADEKGVATDLIVHATAGHRQSTIYVSSTDPWHRAVDVDSLTEQPGVDFVFSSGLTNNLPVLFPGGIAYDVPENTRNLAAYLKSRNYALRGLELGEEPDGQWIAPADFGTLYAQFARQIGTSWPSLPLGGPSFQNIITFADTAAFTEKDWLRQFLAYLTIKGNKKDFSFVSFEWYPFDEVCDPSMPQLLKAPEMLQDAFRGLRPEIIDDHIPIYLTEFGYSVLATDKETKIEGALLDADIVGQFLTSGGNCAYLYGYEPNQVMLENPCNWGNMMLFGMNDDGKILFPTGLYFAAQMYAKEWARPSDLDLKLFRANTRLRNRRNQPFITAYPLMTANGKWSVMLINKNAAQPYKVSLSIRNVITGNRQALRFPADLFQFSRREYLWHSRGAFSRPVRSNAPRHQLLKNGVSRVLLPPYSITVIRQQ